MAPKAVPSTTLNSSGRSEEIMRQPQRKQFFQVLGGIAAGIVIIILLCLAGCGGSNAPVLDQNGQQTGQVVHQDSSFLSNFGAAMAGSAVGNMLFGSRGGSGGYSAPPSVNHTTVNKTIINKSVTVVRPPPVTTSPSVQPPKPTTPSRAGSYSSSGSSVSRSYSSSRSYSGGGSHSYGGRR